MGGLGKRLPDFRCNLAICHLINCFHSLDEVSETVIFYTFLQLTLCHSRTKKKNRFNVAKN
jgi:hypothetical protein